MKFCAPLLTLGLMSCASSIFSTGGILKNGDDDASAEEPDDDTEDQPADHPVPVSGSYLACVPSTEVPEQGFVDFSVYQCSVFTNDEIHAGEVKVDQCHHTSIEVRIAFAPPQSPFHFYLGVKDPSPEALTATSCEMVMDDKQVNFSAGPLKQQINYDDLAVAPGKGKLAELNFNDYKSCASAPATATATTTDSTAAAQLALVDDSSRTVCAGTGPDGSRSLQLTSSTKINFSLQLTDSVFALDDFGVSFWYYMPTEMFTGEPFFIFGSENNLPTDSDPFTIRLCRDEPCFDKILVSANDGAEDVRIESEQPLTPGKWHHIAVSKNEDFLQLYIDGQKNGDAILPSTTLHSTAPWVLGCPSSEFRCATGLIDDFIIWDDDLKSEDVDALIKTGP